MLTIGAAIAGVALGFVVVAALLGARRRGGRTERGGGTRRSSRRRAARCIGRRRSPAGTPLTGPDGTSKWNTDPPTSGPHFGSTPTIVGTVIWGAYDEPVSSRGSSTTSSTAASSSSTATRFPTRRSTSCARSTTTTRTAPCSLRTRSSGQDRARRLGDVDETGSESEAARASSRSARRSTRRRSSTFFSAFQFQGPSASGPARCCRAL